MKQTGSNCIYNFCKLPIEFPPILKIRPFLVWRNTSNFLQNKETFCLSIGVIESPVSSLSYNIILTVDSLQWHQKESPDSHDFKNMSINLKLSLE